jgi:hypothetical protein
MSESEEQSLAETDGKLPPEQYPWRPIEGSGVLADRRFLHTTEVDKVLDTLDATPIADRHLVLAVGSNASPDVMHRKMSRAGIETPLAMTITRHAGVAVGHSAHVSLPGYIAAAPYRCARCVHSFVTLHLDDDQIAALDATEPNYSRVEHDGVWLYASNWQVLAIQGIPVTLRPQANLHSTLSAADRRWGDRFRAMKPTEVATLLAHDGTINEWRNHWRAIGLTRDAGFH